MRNLAVLVILAGVAYLVYTQAMPRYRERKESQNAASEEVEQSRQCLDLANSASSSFSTDLRQFNRPPVDQTLWSSFLLNISGELSAADTACSCPTDTCVSASAALLELRGIVTDLDAFIRSTGPPVTDAARRLGIVHRLLERAAREQR